MTEQDVLLWLWECLRGRSYYCAPRVSYFGWESDLIRMVHGTIHEYEIKLEHGDFLRDQRDKPAKHDTLTTGSCWQYGRRAKEYGPTRNRKTGEIRDHRVEADRPNYFWYVAPGPHVIGKTEVPKYAGLIWCGDCESGGLGVVRRAPQLHPGRAWRRDTRRTLRSVMYRYWTALEKLNRTA